MESPLICTLAKDWFDSVWKDGKDGVPEELAKEAFIAGAGIAAGMTVAMLEQLMPGLGDIQLPDVLNVKEVADKV